MAPANTSWLQRAALRVLATLSLLLIFALGCVASLLLHSNVPVVRALATRTVSTVLCEVFEGQVIIDSLDRLSANGLHVPKVTVQDTAGKTLLEANDVTIRASLLDIVSELLLGDDEIAAVVRHVRVERVNLDLTLDPATGRTTLEQALTLASKPGAQPGAEPSPQTKTARLVSVWLPVIELGEARATLNLGQPQPWEARVFNSKGRVTVSPTGVELEVERFAVSLLGLPPGELRGTGTTHLHFPGIREVEFQGFLNQLEFHMRGRQVGRNVVLALDVPRAEPAVVASLVPNWPLREPAAAYLKASGDWPDLEVNGQLELNEQSSLDVEGTLRIDETPKANLSFFVNKLDLQSFVEKAPHSELTLNGHVALALTQTGPRAEITALSNSTEIAGQSIPGLQLAGNLDADGFVIEGRLQDPGSTGTLQVAAKRGQDVTIQLRLNDTDLDALYFMPDGIAGSASVTLDGTVKDERLTWRVTGQARSLRINEIRAGNVGFEANGQTPLSRPNETRGALHLSATAVAVSNFNVPALKLDAQGPWHTPHIVAKVQSDASHWAEITGYAQLSPQFVLRDLKVSITEKDLQLSGRITEFRPSDSAIEVQELSLSGAGGTLQGWLRYRPGLLESNVTAKALDLARIAHALGMERQQVRGKLDLDLDVTAGSDVTRGRVTLTLLNGSVAGMGSTTLNARAQLHEDALSLDVSGTDGLVGNFGAQANLTLAGSIFEATSFSNATGNAEIRVNDVSLEPINLVLAKDAPVRNLVGRGALQLLLERSQAKTQPNILLNVTVADLGFETNLLDKNYALSGGQLRANVAYNAQAGALNGAVTLLDGGGELLAGSGVMSVDASALSLPTKQLVQALLDAPADFVISMSPRSLDRLPVPITGLLGTVSARATMRGSLAKPRLTGTVSASNVVDAASPNALPLNVLAQGEYSPLTGQVKAQASVNQGTLRVASVLAEGQLPALGDSTPTPTQGTLEAHLQDVPLQVWGPLADSDVRGTLSGALRVRLLPDGVELRAMLSPKDIWVLGGHLGSGTLTLDGGANRVYGQLDLSASQASLAGSISLDFAPEQYLRAAQLDINANNLEAGLLAPAVDTIFTSLNGDLDVQGRLSTSRSGPDQKWETHIDGLAALREGNAHLQVLGLELQDIECTLGARSMGGQNVISLSGLKAKARSSTHNVLGNASLTLSGLRVTNGEASLSINEFPFTLEGVTKGWGTGNARGILTRKPDHMLVEVDVSQLTTRLPLDTIREAYDIEANPDFRILQFETKSTESEGALPWVLLIDLGSRTRLVRGKLQLLVAGTPRIDIGERVSLSGTLTLLPGGRIQAMSKPFVIEHGTISLNPADSANPTVDLRAAWRAPDGATIYASAHGPYQDLNDVELSSDAGLSREEIWERITGSSSSVAPSASEESTDPTAAGGLNAAAFGVNELLGDTLRDVELRIDPSENASYGAAVRVTDRLWFEGRYQRDESAASVGGPSNIVTGAFDFRFARKWSLRTELGNAGGTFDLLWQHRY